MPTPLQLKTEILTGPLATELANPWAIGSDSGVCNILNRRDFGPVTRLIPLGEFSQWLTTSGIRFKLREAERSVSVPNQVKDLVDLVFGMERNPHISVIDPNVAGSIVTALLNARVVDGTDAAAFQTLSVRIGSRAETVWGTNTVITESNVIAARGI